MLGEPVEEVMFVFTGNGCNGKSTIVNAIREILGQSACTVEAETFTTTGGGAGGAGGARRICLRCLVSGSSCFRRRTRTRGLKKRL